MSTFTKQFVFAKIKLGKQRGGVGMKNIQIFWGYLLLYSIFSLTLSFLDRGIILITFVIFILVVKIIPHPDSHRNPFAFGLRFRKRH